MKKILIFIVIAGFVIACGSEENSSMKNSQVAAKVQPVVDGEKVYKQYCVTCHGLYGDMGASGAANLAESQLTLEERIEVVTKGRNTMAAFEGLINAEKIKAVSEFSMKLTQGQ